jgi:hypothetical protein
MAFSEIKNVELPDWDKQSLCLQNLESGAGVKAFVPLLPCGSHQPTDRNEVLYQHGHMEIRLLSYKSYGTAGSEEQAQSSPS